VLALTREFFEQGKLVAFICHGGWIPISAKILNGKRATGSAGIKDDLENAGAIWVDEPVVIDGQLVSSRTPKDLAPFAVAMVNFLNSYKPAVAGKDSPRKFPGHGERYVEITPRAIFLVSPHPPCHRR
jgi:putative intracellular protease/amidase